MKKLLAKKKDNKGFSLVELIVVILIMAVIAVALAPQVMKWVGKSKESTDKNNIGQIESAVNAGVADYMANNNTAKVTPVVYQLKTKSGSTTNEKEIVKVSGGDTTDTLITFIQDAMNKKYPSVQAEKGKDFFISIASTGAVKVEILDNTATPAAPTT